MPHRKSTCACLGTGEIRGLPDGRYRLHKQYLTDLGGSQIEAGFGIQKHPAVPVLCFMGLIAASRAFPAPLPESSRSFCSRIVRTCLCEGMFRMRGLRGFTVCTLLAVIGFAADASEAALAKKLGGSGFSGTLSSNKAIRKQQLIADPDEPDSGSESLQYNPSIVTVSGLTFGPGYTGQAFVEVDNDGSPTLQDLTSFLASPLGPETGYIQLHFNTPVITAPQIHGQIPVANGYKTVDQGGPAGVDTHAFLFNYLSTVPDSAVAVYTIYADVGGRNSGNRSDFLAGHDSSGNYILGPSDIAPITVRGSLNSVPVPQAVWVGGLTLAGLFVATKLRRPAAA
jgi:hypothetical protein